MMPEEVTWRLQMQREMEQIGMMLRAAHYENARLRSELFAREEEVKSTFATPEGRGQGPARGK